MDTIMNRSLLKWGATLVLAWYLWSENVDWVSDMQDELLLYYRAKARYYRFEADFAQQRWARRRISLRANVRYHDMAASRPQTHHPRDQNGYLDGHRY